MNNNSNKYFLLTVLLMGSVVAIIGIIALVFFILKLFAVSMFNIPGSNYIFSLFIVMIPYLILFAGYYFVHKQISLAKNSFSAVAARVILIIGSLVCIAGLVFSLMIFFHVRAQWLRIYDEYASHTFAIHVILILITAGVLATGDPKEESWLERN
jgi:hypothetical protein